MLMIRLQRIGKKKRPTYRVVVSEKNKDTQSGSLEILGIYDPIQTVKKMEFNADRITYWMSKGAQPSPAMKNLLINAGIIKGDKAKAVRVSNKRRKTIDAKKAEVAEKERAAKEAAEKAKADAEAAKAAAEAEAKAAAEAAAAAAPAEEAPAVEAETAPAPAEETPEATA